MPLELENLSGGYTALPIVKDVNLSLQTGEWLSLVGANGSGKSTLLKLVSRILSPQGGVILLDGKAIHSQPPNLVAQKLALLPQQQPVPTGLTVHQLVSLGRTPHQKWWQWELTGNDKQIVETAIQKTQLEKFSDRLVENLSGGERQRAFLALALAQEPKVLLLDEPTTYLDINYQLQLLELLKNLNLQQQLTIVTVLHELNLAARYSSRIALLKQGQLWEVGTPETVLNPSNISEVFGVESLIIQTPIGLQVCAVSSL
ncbi:MAG: ABC transporter ATP-binding protein [Sphaerospermopsis kisseleviana]|jgi:iron complex transport system ATP-binding protein|uniref:ABC transporter related n=2 Tax=Sphaerospermopsis TaxID=752201 RepID=A0A479ZXV9_9CYAN|nr:MULTISPECIES: ABC transporter ATP-binding protein [Sphaerospermopsis]MBD2132918.1 ABC transporter ATP-binding protein [Sphaerospermopsis sp. FACHB-1094]MBD2147266.1 ABC transporter ATP-binding protein [Sphaerospermopsis sp. FACHB-1194]MBE9236294.1 ABC transporter ATP-binding protein [Sphaerospermopsis aphanizomenoides LEGE 00250]GCL36148.1 ABC transporter related [Sphaerospermopsis reniformis]